MSMLRKGRSEAGLGSGFPTDAPGAAGGPESVTADGQMRLPVRVAPGGHLDDSVVEAAKGRDRVAWEAAYAAYGKGLMGFLVLRLGDRDDASEALSETFLRAIEKVPTLRGGADAFRAWLFRIARNVATDRLRVRSRIVLRAEPDDSADSMVAGPDDRAVAREESAEVRRALSTLPPDDREVVWLRVCAGLSSEDVGRIVGKRPGAVRMQQLRALEAMAKRMTD
jgi:RNA polymerase sigma-70 factor, ECF subfamily